jgi:hypothetical protein
MATRIFLIPGCFNQVVATRWGLVFAKSVWGNDSSGKTAAVPLRTRLTVVDNTLERFTTV